MGESEGMLWCFLFFDVWDFVWLCEDVFDLGLMEWELVVVVGVGRLMCVYCGVYVDVDVWDELWFEGW